MAKILLIDDEPDIRHIARLLLEPYGHEVIAGEEPALVPLDGLGAHLGCLDVALGDVDGDGAQDVLVANGFSDDVSVIRSAR